MITESANTHFDELWTLFDGVILDVKGSMYLIDPFKKFFTQSFADGLSLEDARIHLHNEMMKWGETESLEHEIEVFDRHTFEDGQIIELKRFKDKETRTSREFILSAFYNLCCLAANKKTIEELIFTSLSDPNSIPMSENSRKAYSRIIAFSNSFLLAEWSQKFIHRAVANSDEEFFKTLSKSIKKNTAIDKFPVARTWLGTILLWYLGGKDLKRCDFLTILNEKSIVAPSLDLPSFNAMLSKLHLIK